ncbi:GntR family transcriptional regulator [Terribacillus saccharophilus]|uniref:GntR family transcriptional regulator n=1 Tax=Terribacillus saccharophilus TaxID=361277 RepID=A0A075LHJ9_9BACI|nr:MULTISPECIES: GntR family transcriptional regulator [Terribacillus]AIF65352.1 GntR family transcriptional regulator [Terribacillus goriensis]MCM3227229.1 GntR family transcriptional regulator [Terribacillus saccharophilus]MEC0284237.1 GntR family transcriptional regulator [Terribacillus saccharophilus]MEC0289783.1 GntR family transcriptional regulator [Terribacillus saccharophilus]MEC0302750.1 GntR family transcriptional regulator [Terribacillus saccharophilus]
MFELDLRSGKPIYEQIVDKFKELIVNQVLETDEKLPSVRELAQQLTINPNTIQKAYRELENQELIYSVKGRGSFVNAISTQVDPQKVKQMQEELKKLLTEAQYIGMTADEIRNVVEQQLRNGGGSDT